MNQASLIPPASVMDDGTGHMMAGELVQMERLAMILINPVSDGISGDRNE